MRVVEWRDEDEKEGEVVGEKEEEEDEVVEPERDGRREICKNRNRQGEWPLKGVHAGSGGPEYNCTNHHLFH